MKETITGLEMNSEIIRSTDIIRNKHFLNCEFRNLHMSYPGDTVPENRTKIIDCIFEKCTFKGRFEKLYMENVTFQNIKVYDIFVLRGAILKHVKFKEKIDNVYINGRHQLYYLFAPNGQEHGERFITDIEATVLNEYAYSQYNDIDWAVDISEAKFKHCAIDLPPHLIIRDRETQALLKYEKVSQSGWENIASLKGTGARGYCSKAISFRADQLIIAPKRNKKEFEKCMEAIKVLRELGIAELD